MLPPIPSRYQPEAVDPASLGSWLAWALPFFSEPVAQNPHVDLTLQLDVSRAHAAYLALPEGARASFFAFLVWHLTQTLAQHDSFNLRCVDGEWYRLGNPPLFIPVAVGGPTRFRSLVLEDVQQLELGDFLALYRERLARLRHADAGGGNQEGDDAFSYAHFMGHLPQLRFTGMTLHWRQDQMIGQSCFYFGQRYEAAGQLLMPLAVRMHHSCSDPFVLNQLLEDFNRRFPELKSGA